MNKKIWIFFSLILIVIVIGAGAGITRAYFSDTETSSQNSIAAGTWTNWYDIHWTYRTPITITNSVAALSNYQIQLTISAANSYQVANMKADFSDIRFTDDDGTTLLSYWIESINASPQSAVVWVKVPVINASPTTTNIYLYYGYSSAASTSNPYQTFVLFEDFETGSLNTNAGRPLGPGQGVWTVTASGTGTPAASATLVQSGSESPSFIAPHGSYVLKLNDTSNARNITAYCDFAPNQTLFTVDYYARPSQTGATFEMQINNGSTIGPRMRFNTTNIQTNTTGTWTSRQAFSASSTYTFNLNNIKTAGAAALDTYNLVITGPTSSSNSGLRFSTTSDYTAGLNRVYFTGSTATTGILYIDLIKVRAYAPSTPTATPGTQQSQLSEDTVNWPDFSWYFRKPITITNPNAYALTDYRLNISVPLITGKMQANFSDLRFTADDGLTPLKYYIQSSSSPANIWVKVPSIAASGTTTIIYMYYGYYYGSSSPATPPLDLNNSLAGTYSFYDEMDDSALSQWTASSGNITKTRVTSPVQNGTYSMQISNTATNTYVTSTSFTAGNLCVIEFGIHAAQTTRIWEVRLLGDPSGTTIGPYFRLNTGGTPPVQYYDTAWRAFSPAITWTSGIFYPVQINPAFVDSNIYQFNFNGNQRSAIPFGATTTTNLKQIVFFGTGSPGTIYVDSVKVYGYAASTPTYVFGSEQ